MRYRMCALSRTGKTRTPRAGFQHPWGEPRKIYSHSLQLWFAPQEHYNPTSRSNSVKMTTTFSEQNRARSNLLCHGNSFGVGVYCNYLLLVIECLLICLHRVRDGDGRINLTILTIFFIISHN